MRSSSSFLYLDNLKESLSRVLAPVSGANRIPKALGILFAPDTGANTRDKLSFKLSKYKKELEDLINELVDGKEIHLNEAKTEGKRVISETKNKAEDLLNDVNKLIDQINQDKN